MYRHRTLKLLLVVGILSISQAAMAQSPDGGNSPFLIGLIALVVIFLFVVIITVANRLMRMTAERVGAADAGSNFSVIPKASEVFGTEKPSNLEGQNVKVLNKGFDMPLAGVAEKVLDTETTAVTFAIQPTDIIGMSPIPKVVVAVGDTVKAGDPLFYDKKNPEVIYTSPVSGEFIELNRGDKRRIEEVVILADKDIQYKSFDAPSLDANREEILHFLLESGAAAHIRQRPYNVAVNPAITPKNIFISTFDTAPLAPDLSFVIQGKEAAFQKGLDVLATLTDGQVFLGLDGRKGSSISTAFSDATGAVKTYFTGKHPAGNVGVQIHHTAPINAGDTVWTLDVQAVATIGTLFLEGKYDASRVVALTGAEFKENKYVKTYQGASISNFVNENISTEDKVRLVSGDVLTGKQISEKGFVGFFDDQITTLVEGDYYEAFGWLLPLKPRASVSPTFPRAIYPAQLKADTNTHGEKRAFVVTGQYESVTPMDIYPQHLMKAILVNDYERMEGLGIYEVVEEDLALCEFVCTSKQDVQSILREGLDMMRAQG